MFFYQVLLVIVGYFVSGLIGPIFRYGFILVILVRFVLVIICLGLDFAIVLFWVLFWYGLILLFVLLFLARLGLYFVWFYFVFYFGSASFTVEVGLFWLWIAWAYI